MFRFLREALAEPLGADALRAFGVFVLLLLVFAFLIGQIAATKMSLGVLEHRVTLGLAEATRIADAVLALGREGGRMEFRRLRSRREALAQAIRERLQTQPYLQEVEVLDRFGGRVLRLSRDADELFGVGALRGEPQFITVDLLKDGESEGQVRVGIASEQIQKELEALRRALWMRIALASALALVVLVAGILYILYLIRKNRELERRRLAAERRSYTGLLASGLAHEIRNPLNAMNMNLQMLEEEMELVPEAARTDFKDLLASTKSEIKRLERLVNNFLLYARPAPLSFESRDLNSVLKDVARFLQADFQQSGVVLEQDLEPMLPRVELDETQFRQALMNLLVNARQVLAKGGRVVLRTRVAPSGEVVVEVEDNGPGVPEEVRERMFDVFFSNRGGGTGLGLPIARQIIERHGGRIEVESEPGRGTIFRIVLPRRHRGTEAPAGAVEAAS